ncbi:unnamed protein product, partial [marine sediment metagenome]
HHAYKGDVSHQMDPFSVAVSDGTSGEPCGGASRRRMPAAM